MPWKMDRSFWQCQTHSHTLTIMYVILSGVNSKMFLYPRFLFLHVFPCSSLSLYLSLALWPEAHSVVWRAIDFSSLSFSRWDFDRIMALWKQRKLFFDNRGEGEQNISYMLWWTEAGAEATIEFLITVSKLKVQWCRTKSQHNRPGRSVHFICHRTTGQCTP